MRTSNTYLSFPFSGHQFISATRRRRPRRHRRRRRVSSATCACLRRAMGLRRYERVKNSTRPAAKLGGGGGWNTEERDRTDGTVGGVGGGGGVGDPLPPFPGTHQSARWGVQGPAAEGASPGLGSAEKDYITTIKPSDMPRMKAFSGRGWRKAAPGFGDAADKEEGSSDAAAAPPKQPKILIGNLATDVAPEVLRDLIETHVDALDLDVPGELKAVHMAVFGPARPKLKRDRGRLHRGFAMLEFTTREAAEAASSKMHAADLHTLSLIHI